LRKYGKQKDETRERDGDRENRQQDIREGDELVIPSTTEGAERYEQMLLA